MGFRIIAPKRVKKTRAKSSQEVLRRLEEYLKDSCDEPVQILCGFWEDQQNAITYQEIRQAVLDGVISQEMLHLWSQDYSVLVTNRMSKLWTDAIAAGPKGQPLLDGLSYEFNTQTPGILNWLSGHGAEFVTSSTQAQKDAIEALLTKKMRDGHTVDELSRLIRPCIGLTEGDAKATARLYDSIVENLKKEHPRMKPESIRRKALASAQKYAERKHRQRAMTIAQTESAFAYNRGADEGIKQAQELNLLGLVKKRWCTSGDDGVCDICSALDGVEIDMDSEFDFKGRILFQGHHRLPPAHPRCACAIEYIEVEPPVFSGIPQPPISITEENSFREYSDEEIVSIAEQTDSIISKHINIPSKWSGNMVITDEGVYDGVGNVVNYGKLWNCDILTEHETAPAIILHEQLHARSISHYGPEVFAQCKNIEEASVQLMVEEICKIENIEVISSMYDDGVKALRQIGGRIGIYETDYEFAKNLIQIPVMERMGWLSDGLYDILGKDPTATLEEYQSMSALLNMLY